MKIRPVVFGFFPNPFRTYRVRNGRIEIVGIAGGLSESVPMEGAHFSVKGAGPFRLGIGTIIVTGSNNQTLELTGVPQAKRVRIKLESGEENGDAATGSEPTNSRSIPVEFLLPEARAKHFVKLSSTTSPPPEIEAAKTDGEWKIQTEWCVKTSGESDGTTSALAISWSPDGKLISVGCNAYSVLVFEASGRRIGGPYETRPRTRSDALFWSNDSQFILHQGATANSDYSRFADRYGNNIGIVRSMPKPIGSEWAISDSFNNTRGTSPFRPGFREILVAPYQANTIATFNFDNFEKSVKRNKPLIDYSPSKVISLSELGAENNECSRFYWHPSGQYLAISCKSQDAIEANSSHVVHFDSGEIISSWNGQISVRGWSPGGRVLLLCEQNADGLSYTLWEVDNSTPLTTNNLDELPTWARYQALVADKRGTDVNCSGDRYLRYLWPARDGRYAIKIVRNLQDETIEEIEFERPGHFAWCPNNPNVFAMVGANGRYDQIQIWEFS